MIINIVFSIIIAILLVLVVSILVNLPYREPKKPAEKEEILKIRCALSACIKFTNYLEPQDFTGLESSPNSYISSLEFLSSLLEYSYKFSSISKLPMIDTSMKNLLSALSAIDWSILETPQYFSINSEALISILRLLNHYQYLRNPPKKSEKCHQEILRLTSKIPERFSDSLKIQIEIQKLLTLRIHDSDLFITELQKIEISKLSKLNFVFDDSGEPGIYSDGSFLNIENIADYSDISNNRDLTLLLALDHPGEDFQKFQKIFQKLLHPYIPFLPPVFGRNRFDYISALCGVTGELGCHLFPFIGLGIFKTPKISFSVRVQREGRKFGNKTDADLLLGSQIRKIYIRNCHYSPELTWNRILREPGVLSRRFPSVKKEFTCSKASSFIGNLDDKLMFWKNVYSIEEYYGDCLISEAGVVTADGAQIFYRIKNNTDEVLSFRCRDEFKGFKENEGLEGEFVEIGKEVKEFTLKMMLTDANYQVALTWPDEVLKFEYEGSQYNSISIDSEQYVLMKITGGTKEAVACGSSSSKIKSTITYGGVLFDRDEKTLMYKKH